MISYLTIARLHCKGVWGEHVCVPLLLATRQRQFTFDVSQNLVPVLFTSRGNRCSQIM